MAAAPPREGHPSASRGQAKPASLLYGLIAAPAAWMAAQVVSSTLAARACFPKYEPLAAPAFPGLHLAHALALLAALAICASGAVVAYGAWRRTRSEHEGGSGTLLDIGEGRSRFMALAGLLTSVGFLLGVLFSVPAALFVPAC